MRCCEERCPLCALGGRLAQRPDRRAVTDGENAVEFTNLAQHGASELPEGNAADTAGNSSLESRGALSFLFPAGAEMPFSTS